MILPKFVDKDKYGKFINFFSSFGDIASKAGNFLYDSFANSIDSLVDNFFGTGLTPAQREANQFTADQAAIAYERKKEFYEQYESIGAQVDQAISAGVNPAALYGNLSGGSSSSVPQAAGSVSPDSSPVDNLLGLASMLFNMSETKKMNDVKKSNIQADTDNKNANTAGTTIANQYLETYYILREKGLEAALRKTESEISVNEQNVEESRSRQALNLSIKALNDVDLQTRSELNDIAVRYMSAQASMEEERANQYKQELEAKLANTIAQTQFYNAEASQIRAYCKEMLSTFEFTDENGVAKEFSSRIAKMSDEEINTIRKERSMMWTKGVDSISRGIATIAGAAFGTAAVARGGTRSSSPSYGGYPSNTSVSYFRN